LPEEIAFKSTQPCRSPATCKDVAGSSRLPEDPVAVAKTGLQAGRQRRPLPVQLLLPLVAPELLLPVVVGLVLARLLDGVDAGLAQGDLLQGCHHAVIGVEGPQFPLLSQCIRVLLIHLGEQDLDIPRQSAKEKAGNRRDISLGKISKHLGHQLGGLPGSKGRQLEQLVC